MKKIYTKTGDGGFTSVMDKTTSKLTKVAKCDPVVEAIGTVDELNCHVGMLLSYPDIINRDTLTQIQNDLFVIGSVLANFIDTHTVSANYLETEMDSMCRELSPLKNFILPGGSPIISQCHMARVVTRRAERRIVAIEEIDLDIVKYINRLSDYFFILARMIAKISDTPEIIWSK